MTTVPAVVVVHAILVVVTIRPVALLVIRNEIVQGEAIVGSHVVHALVGVIRVGAAVGEKIIAAIDTPHQVRNHPGIAFDKTADVVAESSVPLQPGYTGESAAELISTCIPRLRDQAQPT